MTENAGSGTINSIKRQEESALEYAFFPKGEWKELRMNGETVRMRRQDANPFTLTEPFMASLYLTVFFSPINPK